jgi:hypothetical protein
VKTTFKFLSVLTLGFIFSAFASANTVWDLTNVTFDDGPVVNHQSTTNAATGSFTIDSSFNIISWNITVTGSNTPADFTFTNADSEVYLSSDHKFILFSDSDFDPLLGLDLVSALPSGSGSPINLQAGSGLTQTGACGSWPNQCTNYHTGSIVDAPTATPEPSTAILCVPAMLGLAFFRRRKMATAQQVIS